jgi:prefoldin alpha subunit
LTRIDSVLLDIGTGYFAEKTIEEAQSYFQRKIEYLAKQIEDVQPSLLEKQKTREVVFSVLQTKMQQLAAQSKTTSS